MFVALVAARENRLAHPARTILDIGIRLSKVCRLVAVSLLLTSAVTSIWLRRQVVVESIQGLLHLLLVGLVG